MESEISRVKRARLSLNQIREIVMDSDSDEEKNYASDSTEDGQEPRPPSQTFRYQNVQTMRLYRLYI